MAKQVGGHNLGNACYIGKRLADGIATGIGWDHSPNQILWGLNPRWDLKKHSANTAQDFAWGGDRKSTGGLQLALALCCAALNRGIAPMSQGQISKMRTKKYGRLLKNPPKNSQPVHRPLDTRTKAQKEADKKALSVYYRYYDEVVAELESDWMILHSDVIQVVQNLVDET